MPKRKREKAKTRSVCQLKASTGELTWPVWQRLGDTMGRSFGDTGAVCADVIFETGIPSMWVGRSLRFRPEERVWASVSCEVELALAADMPMMLMVLMLMVLDRGAQAERGRGAGQGTCTVRVRIGVRVGVEPGDERMKASCVCVCVWVYVKRKTGMMASDGVNSRSRAARSKGSGPSSLSAPPCPCPYDPYIPRTVWARSSGDRATGRNMCDRDGWVGDDA